MDWVKDEVGDQWRNEILRDLESLPFIGVVPGTLMVFGDHAHPILRNPQERSAWIAAGELGQGRVFVITHARYIGNFKTKTIQDRPELAKFHQNIKLWLTKHRGADDSEIEMLTNITDKTLNGIRIIVCTPEKHTNISDETIKKFVEDGGALIHCLCPWGWLQAHRHLNLDDVPLYNVLEKVGIIYTKGYFHCPREGIKIECCMAPESYHVARALENLHLNDSCETLSQIDELPRKTLQIVLEKFEHILQQIVDERGHEGIPSENKPTSSTVGKSMMYVHTFLAQTLNSPSKMPGVMNFPGDFDSEPLSVKAEIMIDSSIDACHPTGFYVPAGKEITVEVLSEEPLNQGWEILVGAHTDKLHISTPMKRWPIISEKFKISTKKFKIYTPFGGLLYVCSPCKRGCISLHVHNVIEAPLFDLTRPETDDRWLERRMAPGLWADICGKYIVLTLPSSSVREVANPRDVLETLDRVVTAHHHLRGTDPGATRREWIVTDIQPSGGYMHSGYPIVTHMDVANPDNPAFLLNNGHLLNTGNWGLFHELGHNMQRPAWTFNGTGEVTCNIFTLHSMDVISNVPIWIHPWLKSKQKQAQEYIANSYEFSKWQSDPGIALFVYAQIIHQFGWAVYRKIFRHYEENSRCIVLKTENEKIDYWFQTMSNFTEHNLAPLADLWNIPLSDTCKQQLVQYPPFLPDDEITRAVQEKVEKIMGMYPCIITSVDKLHYYKDKSYCYSRKYNIKTCSL